MTHGKDEKNNGEYTKKWFTLMLEGNPLDHGWIDTANGNSCMEDSFRLKTDAIQHLLD